MLSTEAILAAARPRLRRFVADHGDAALELVKHYAHAEYETIGGWLANTVPPINKLIKVWHLLQMMGFESPEMGDFDDLTIYLGRLYALDVIPMEELIELLKVKNQQTAIQFLRGQPSMKLKPTALPGLRAMYVNEMAAKMSDLPEDLMVATATALPAAPAEPALVDDAERPLSLWDVLNPMDVPLTLAMVCAMALPLAQRLVDGTPQDREAFRTAASLRKANSLFLLVEFLDALRTPAAYEDFRARR